MATMAILRGHGARQELLDHQNYGRKPCGSINHVPRKGVLERPAR